jgi:superoxide dismutase, Fe-Mn family
MIKLPELPYAKDALSPFINEETLNLHYDKHHTGYLNNLNKLLEGSDLEGASLEKIITKTHGNDAMKSIFNNAAQVWNHTFYWNSMKPLGGGAPEPSLLKKIVSVWGSFDAFKAAFKEAGMGQFGSGWVWLCLKDGELFIAKTSNAETPMTQGALPLLTCDVWEHAYYIDYQNRRADYISVFLDNLVNWEFAQANYQAGM